MSTSLVYHAFGGKASRFLPGNLKSYNQESFSLLTWTSVAMMRLSLRPELAHRGITVRQPEI